MKKKKRIVIIGVLTVLLILFCYIQNNLLTTTEYTYYNKKLPKELDGYTIVQISDLHNKRFGRAQRRLLSRISAQSPDLIVITGDIIDSNRTDFKPALELVEGTAKLAPVYYVTGNHENWLSQEDLTALLSGIQERGAIVLDDESILLSENDAAFALSGLDDSSLSKYVSSESDADNSRLHILLAHEPQYLPAYANLGADLVLTGHAHGGQFVLPLLGGLYAPDQGFLPTYTHGMYESGATTMIVSRGLGNSVIPVRLFNYPEIICVTLRHR